METVPKALGNGRYDQLQAWLSSPAQRVRRVLEVSAASWWPDGQPPQGRRPGARAANRRVAGSPGSPQRTRVAHHA